MGTTVDANADESRSVDDLLGENAQLNNKVASLTGEVDELKHQLQWLKRQLFGSKSEARPFAHPDQLALLQGTAAQSVPAGTPEKAAPASRGKAPKQRDENCVTDSGLRFGPDVPVHTITHYPESLKDLDESAWQRIGENRRHRLIKRPATYAVLCEIYPVIKLNDTGEILEAPRAASLFDQSIADVSAVAGWITDKFAWHLPLYRQWQQATDAGITLSRSTPINLSGRALDLLEPIADVQLSGSVLLSRALAMDESPLKVGRSKTKAKRMHQGYVWPVYGDRDEVNFIYKTNRGKDNPEAILGTKFTGTLLCDGYVAYTKYRERNQRVTLAHCWSHVRRKFFEARDTYPETIDTVLDLIAELYANEKFIRQKDFNEERIRQYRLDHTKPVIDKIFQWAQDQLQRTDMLPDEPLAKAIGYMVKRETELRVFLREPDVAPDTNHLERMIRPVAQGRRNWLFAWSELGAKHICIAQTLICTCRLHDINPYTYLVDVLQRIQTHPNSKIHELTPRHWKQNFADNPMKSVFYDIDQNGRE